ncbi:MAG TPA: endolytic transglycosylase MltG [bacterium]|nr:endolytic transglycosylase MltG [bacterium]HPT29731.1 endolytic transglycosylase MltG [bacterium]
MRRRNNRKNLIWLLILLIASIVIISQVISRHNKAQEAKQAALVLEEKTITIIEGWNIDNIAAYLKKQGFKDANDLLGLKVKDYSGQYNFLLSAPANASLEGYLFPDTYRVYADATLDDLVKKMLDNFDTQLNNELRQAISSQGKKIHQIVTMASVIEKEVSASTDRGIVSGIFWRRITNGQPLESCATLAYVLGEYKAQYSKEDTMVESDYNTYRHYGLPPGPIASPGIASLRAAIYPQKTNYNYFLTRPDTGETVYSRTFQEHIDNKAKYLK